MCIRHDLQYSLMRSAPFEIQTRKYSSLDFIGFEIRRVRIHINWYAVHLREKQDLRLIRTSFR